jgi:hypothetical protein
MSSAVPLEDAASVAGPDGRDLAHRVEQSQDMRVALGRLPAQQREAIELAYYADLPQREIAERLDCRWDDQGPDRAGPAPAWPPDRLACDALTARALPGRGQRAVADGFCGQDAEQVEIRRFLILEGTHFVPGTISRAENLESLFGPQQADGAVGLLFQRVRGAWDGGQVGQFRKD